ncbi:MAG: DNA mismatch repair protein MutS, partial [Candidatus Lokiarchaeota archaeon]|nr:DNA mismatch repair protein MutS [Candidatus Lokiarchaeota archaeon]MBD3342472.1 DNA mismatch repair protein MutS [Candidatus Lokiarchaeota archaeon]
SDVTEAILKTYESVYFDYEEAYQLIKRHFKLSNLKGLGLEGKENKLAVRAAGSLLAFLKETQRDMLPNIFKITRIQEKQNLHLDYVTQRNLELIHSLWEKGKDTTVYKIFNHTHTPMGARLLKKIILKPLIDIEQIQSRLRIVEKFKDDVFLRSDLRDALSEVGDLERFVNKINYISRSNARDLINIKNSLEIIPKLRTLLQEANIPEISRFLDNINDFAHIRNLVHISIKDDPSPNLKEGNIIKDGHDEELDRLRDILNNGKNFILDYEEEQRKKWNLNSGLKVGHNNILGYYIQITKKTLQNLRIPDEYVERQTLKNSKRFTTTELKNIEQKVVTAEEKIFDLEYDLFCEIREKVIEETGNIIKTAQNLAMVDVLACFAEISEKYNYCRPIINEDTKILIEEGRHPVVEQIHITDKFIPNDCYLDNNEEQIRIITGPNMSGKSTYLRQVALICLIAQMGCFVPAKSAKIGIIDQIFTRIGASDDLARKLSTFMIEMTETAKILNYATPKSLVIIDELGRGTSTSDGQSIAMATLEKLHELKTKTLFSTHYHQLTEIKLPRVKNYHLDIIENEDGSINFVRKLHEGSTDKSYGIHVAKLAGIPDDVIIRAFQILEKIEKKDLFKNAVKENGNQAFPTKYHNMIINEKEKRIDKLNQEINAKKNELDKFEENLSNYNKKLRELSSDIERLKKKKGQMSTTLSKKPANKSRSKKKLVQTSFFRPLVKKENVIGENFKEIVELINNKDIQNITPVEAMKYLISLKEKLEELSINQKRLVK